MTKKFVAKGEDSMKRPCKSCPFRRDVKPYLTRWFGFDLAFRTRYYDSKFYCHETVDYSSRKRSPRRTANAQLCRGFAILRAQEAGNRFVEDADLVYRSMGEMVAAYAEKGR